MTSPESNPFKIISREPIDQARAELDQAEEARISARRTSRSFWRNSFRNVKDIGIKIPGFSKDQPKLTANEILVKTRYEHSEALRNFAHIQAEQEALNNSEFANRENDPSIMDQYRHAIASRRIEIYTNEFQRFIVKEIETNQQKGRLEKFFEWYQKNPGKRALGSLAIAGVATVATLSGAGAVALGAGALLGLTRFGSSAVAVERATAKIQEKINKSHLGLQNKVTDEKLRTMSAEEKAARLSSFMEYRVLKGEKNVSQEEQSIWQSLKNDISQVDTHGITLHEQLDHQMANERRWRALRWTTAIAAGMALPFVVNETIDYVKNHIPTITYPSWAPQINLAQNVNSISNWWQTHAPTWIGGEEIHSYYFENADPRKFDALGNVIPNGWTSSITGRGVGLWAETYVNPELGANFDGSKPEHWAKFREIYNRNPQLNEQRVNAMIEKLYKLNGAHTILNNPDEFPHTIAPNSKQLLPFFEPKDKKGFFEAIKIA